MEGQYARRAFPCFDESSFKATFDITLRHQEEYPWADKEGLIFRNVKSYIIIYNMFLLNPIKGSTIALSNMPLKTERTCQNGWCENIFETTQKMSTYLVVFAIVDFGSLKTQTLVEGEKKHNHRHKVS